MLTNSNVGVDDIGLKILDNSRQLTLPKKDKEAIDLSEEILERYVGEYELAPNFTITVTRKGTQLFGQGTGQPQFEMFASAETEFFLRVVEASVSFILDDEGNTASLVLHQAGQDVPGKKIK